MKAAMIFGVVFLVILAFSVSLSLGIADAAKQHDWLGMAFWLSILVIVLGAIAGIVFTRKESRDDSK